MSVPNTVVGHGSTRTRQWFRLRAWDRRGWCCGNRPAFAFILEAVQKTTTCQPSRQRRLSSSRPEGSGTFDISVVHHPGPWPSKCFVLRVRLRRLGRRWRARLRRLLHEGGHGARRDATCMLASAATLGARCLTRGAPERNPLASVGRSGPPGPGGREVGVRAPTFSTPSSSFPPAFFARLRSRSVPRCPGVAVPAPGRAGLPWSTSTGRLSCTAGAPSLTPHGHEGTSARNK